jgi:hypoxanthine-guanine phosphoribosyltransferase
MEYYAGQTINILVVLRGAFRFAKDLIDYIDMIGKENMKNYEIQFIRCA